MSLRVQSEVDWIRRSLSFDFLHFDDTPLAQIRQEFISTLGGHLALDRRGDARK